MPATSTADFVAKAVEFCNDTLWGTLSATIIVHPKTLADGTVARAVEEAVADLRYGAIGVNIWHAIDFALGVTTWGAYPGHQVTDIQSGRGVVGNANMFDRPQKSVVRGPFRSRPKPPWFATTKNQLAIMHKMVAFEADPTPQKIPGILLAALRAEGPVALAGTCLRSDGGCGSLGLRRRWQRDAGQRAASDGNAVGGNGTVDPGETLTARTAIGACATSRLCYSSSRCQPPGSTEWRRRAWSTWCRRQRRRPDRDRRCRSHR